MKQIFVMCALLLGVCAANAQETDTVKYAAGNDLYRGITRKLPYRQMVTPYGVEANPVIDSDNPDPTVIKAEDGYFYLYATGGNTWIHKSKDLVHWTYVSGAYEEDKKPSWEPDAGIWAPDINYIDGKYV